MANYIFVGVIGNMDGKALGIPGGEKIDEARVKNANLIERILINAPTVDVIITRGDSKNIEVHLSGTAVSQSDVELIAKQSDSEYRISVISKKNVSLYDMKLEVKLPKKTFKLISVEGSSGDVHFNSGVHTNIVHANTESGNVVVNAVFSVAHIATESGDITMTIDAKSDISLKINSESGDINVQLMNIAKVLSHFKSESGYVKSTYYGHIGHTATLNISTESGDIRIK